jgi:hypothetical protein
MPSSRNWLKQSGIMSTFVSASIQALTRQCRTDWMISLIFFTDLIDETTNSLKASLTTRMFSGYKSFCNCSTLKLVCLQIYCIDRAYSSVLLKSMFATVSTLDTVVEQSSSIILSYLIQLRVIHFPGVSVFVVNDTTVEEAISMG